MHVRNIIRRAGLFGVARKIHYGCLCIAGVVVDIYGRHGTKWKQGARCASGGPERFLLWVGVPNRMGPLRGQSIKWEQGTGC